MSFFSYDINILLFCNRPYSIPNNLHCVKSVHIRSYSGPYFPAFGLNAKRYSVCIRIQIECGKMQTRITPNKDSFYAVRSMQYISVQKCI